MKKIYLAGPDVFVSNPEFASMSLKAACQKYGFEGMFPLDNAIENFENNQETANRIFKANVEMIRKCDIVLANMHPFRGPSMDVGTAWEMGMAFALGKTVVGYNCNQSTLREKTLDADVYRTPDYPQVEDFGLIDNLMLTESCEFMAMDLENALKYCKAKMKA